MDGTDEAEMICFGEVARRIVGKPVQQVLRASTSTGTYPPDITKLVALRFTFQVSLTQQSYYREHKTYQVVSVVTSYGQENAIAHGPVNPNGGPHVDPPADQALLGAADDTTEKQPSISVTEDIVLSPPHETVSCFYVFCCSELFSCLLHAFLMLPSLFYCDTDSTSSSSCGRNTDVKETHRVTHLLSSLCKNMITCNSDE